jgi:hypothetical protein
MLLSSSLADNGCSVSRISYNRSLSYATLFQSTRSQFISLGYILILLSHLRLYLSSFLLSSGFPIKQTLTTNRCSHITLSHYLTVSLPHYLSHYLIICLTISLSHYLTICLTVSLCHCLTTSLSVSLSHYLSHYLTVSLSHYLSHYLTASLSHCLSVSLSHYLSHYITVSLAPS